MKNNKYTCKQESKWRENQVRVNCFTVSLLIFWIFRSLIWHLFPVYIKVQSQCNLVKISIKWLYSVDGDWQWNTFSSLTPILYTCGVQFFFIFFWGSRFIDEDSMNASIKVSLLVLIHDCKFVTIVCTVRVVFFKYNIFSNSCWSRLWYRNGVDTFQPGEFEKSRDRRAFLLVNCSVSQPEILRPAECTTGQFNNVLFWKLRTLRLTASNFGEILRCMEGKDFRNRYTKRLGVYTDQRNPNKVNWMIFHTFWHIWTWTLQPISWRVSILCAC